MSSAYVSNNYYSAPEVYHKPESVPLEVLSPQSPEVAHDPRAYPPEIATTNAPQLVHGPQDFPPEAVPNQFPEEKDKPWDADAASSQNLVVEKDQKKQSFFKRHWILLTLLALLVIGGAVGGGVGGVLASKSKSKLASEAKSTDTGSAASDEAGHTTAGPVDAPPSLSATTGLAAGVPKLMQSTSFAATGCPDGDRWVFMQDDSGNIRAAHYNNSELTWRFATEQYNFTAASLGTSMSASCVNITEDVGVPLGIYLSLAYINPSKGIQQTVFSGGAWKDSPVAQSSKLPSENCYISVSTSFRPLSLQNELVKSESEMPTQLSPQSFSSVVTYQNNATLFMIDLDPRSDSKPATNASKNLLANFQGTTDVNYNLNIGFACEYNMPIPLNTTHYYTRCFMGNSREVPEDDKNAGIMVRIYDYIWEYTVAEAFKRTDKKYNYVDNGGYDEYYGTQPFATGIVLAPLADDRIGIVSIGTDNKFVVNDVENYHRPGESGMDDSVDPSSPKIPPDGYFGAASPGSTTVYVYYQVNGTAIAEITYENSRSLWGKDTSYLVVT